MKVLLTLCGGSSTVFYFAPLFFCFAVQKHDRLMEQLEKLQKDTVNKGLYAELTHVNTTLETELECLRSEIFKLKVSYSWLESVGTFIFTEMYCTLHLFVLLL